MVFVKDIDVGISFVKLYNLSFCQIIYFCQIIIKNRRFFRYLFCQIIYVLSNYISFVKLYNLSFYQIISLLSNYKRDNLYKLSLLLNYISKNLRFLMINYIFCQIISFFKLYKKHNLYKLSLLSNYIIYLFVKLYNLSFCQII